MTLNIGPRPFSLTLSRFDLIAVTAIVGVVFYNVRLVLVARIERRRAFVSPQLDRDAAQSFVLGPSEDDDDRGA